MSSVRIAASLLNWSPATWTAIGTLALAGATLVLAGVAVFAEPLRRWFSRTAVNVQLRSGPPDLHQIELTLPGGVSAGKALYSRLRVSNEGTVAAESVEVFVSEVRLGSTVVPTFLPLSLTWSHFQPPSSTVRIPAGMYRHCDFGRFQEVNGRVVFIMSTIVQPNATAGGAPPNFLEEGDYELDTIIGGDNASLTTATWRLHFQGPWSDDESEMLTRVALSRIR